MTETQDSHDTADLDALRKLREIRRSYSDVTIIVELSESGYAISWNNKNLPFPTCRAEAKDLPSAVKEFELKAKQFSYVVASLG